MLEMSTSIWRKCLCWHPLWCLVRRVHSCIGLSPWLIQQWHFAVWSSKSVIICRKQTMIHGGFELPRHCPPPLTQAHAHKNTYCHIFTHVRTSTHVPVWAGLLVVFINIACSLWSCSINDLRRVNNKGKTKREDTQNGNDRNNWINKCLREHGGDS